MAEMARADIEAALGRALNEYREVCGEPPAKSVTAWRGKPLAQYSDAELKEFTKLAQAHKRLRIRTMKHEASVLRELKWMRES